MSGIGFRAVEKRFHSIPYRLYSSLESTLRDLDPIAFDTFVSALHPVLKPVDLNAIRLNADQTAALLNALNSHNVEVTFLYSILSKLDKWPNIKSLCQLFLAQYPDLKNSTNTETNVLSQQAATTKTTTTALKSSSAAVGSSSRTSSLDSIPTPLSNTTNTVGSSKTYLMSSEKEQLQPSSQQQQPQELAPYSIISLYEELIPIYIEKMPTAADSMMMLSGNLSVGSSSIPSVHHAVNSNSTWPVSIFPSSSSSTSTSAAASSVPNSLTTNSSNKWAGKFALVHLPERNLSMKKRMFLNVFDYIKELKMIRHRHNNLYTAEFIYKGFKDQNLYLLYSLEPYSSVFLPEFAQQIQTTIDPAEYDPITQMTLLSDISCALAYLHTITEQKDKILHGNLTPESIIIETQHSYKRQTYTAKLYNFERIIEIKEKEVQIYDTQIQEELYNFGLIIFYILSYRRMDKIECDEMHRNNPSKESRIDLYQKLNLETSDSTYNTFKNRFYMKFIYYTSPDQNSNNSQGDISKFHLVAKKWLNEYKKSTEL